MRTLGPCRHPPLPLNSPTVVSVVGSFGDTEAQRRNSFPASLGAGGGVVGRIPNSEVPFQGLSPGLPGSVSLAPMGQLAQRCCDDQ